MLTVCSSLLSFCSYFSVRLFHCCFSLSFPVTRASFFYTYIPTMYFWLWCFCHEQTLTAFTAMPHCLYFSLSNINRDHVYALFVPFQGYLNSVAYGWSCGDFLSVMWSRWKLATVCTPLLWSFSSWVFSHFSFSAVYNTWLCICTPFCHYMQHVTKFHLVL